MKRARIGHFLLASASPRRRLLLRQAGLTFTVKPTPVAERAPKKLSHSALVQFLALKKARWLSKRKPNEIVLGADTLVFLDGKAIGKPRDPRHAAQILRTLSGRWQRVYTGVAVVWAGGNKARTGFKLSWVKFRKLSDDEVRRYSTRHLDKAGAYSVQSKNDRFVERIRGDYDNVVGLPVGLSRRLLRGAFETLSKLV